MRFFFKFFLSRVRKNDVLRFFLRNHVADVDCSLIIYPSHCAMFAFFLPNLDSPSFLPSSLIYKRASLIKFSSYLFNFCQIWFFFYQTPPIFFVFQFPGGGFIIRLDVIFGTKRRASGGKKRVNRSFS